MNWLELLSNEAEHGLSRGEPMYARIMAGIRHAIQSGQLADNSRLPTNRELATLLKVDRSTISRAYLELSQSGLIDSHVGRGTYVRPTAMRQQSGAAARVSNDSQISWTEKFSDASRACADLVARQPDSVEQDGLISFAGGLPTEEFFPNSQFKRIVVELMESDYSAEMFGYSAAEGSPYLRTQVKRHLSQQGVSCNDDELLIVSGSQQGIDLVTDVFVNPDDTVLLEDPSYFWAICNFRARQARCIPVSLDDEGLRLEQLESLMSRQKAKLLYVMPNFQNPTGSTMSLTRRMALIDLALKYQVPILEDNFVGDLIYDGGALPPLISLPGGKDVVIHQGTFSKALCPGLRLGWLVAPRAVTARLLLAKRTSDLSTNSIAQIILARYLEEGLYAQHLEHVRSNYRARRDAMLNALTSQFPLQSTETLKLTWSKPDGGLFIWAKLPSGLSARELLVFAESQGVSFSPGDMFFVNGGNSEYFRLCFIQTDPSVIEKGIERLAKAVRSYFETVARSNLLEISSRARVRNNVLI
ncbi:MAG TPA: PLP-dependent aminotransferase family protein [Drouetiella sp.]